jgi:predicted nucleotidyltransferase
MTAISDNIKIKPVLEDLKNKLKELFADDLVQIIIFGSYINGNYDNDSDLDVFVIINNEDTVAFEDVLLDVTVDLSLCYNIVITAFLESRSNFIKYKNIKPFYSEIQNNGIDIYAA